jgi:hypothetical protein
MKPKRTRLFSALTLSGGLMFTLLWLLGAGLPARAMAGAELHVCSSGCAYSSVQAAVDASTDGDVIKVAAGHYTNIHQRVGITQVLYISKTVTVQGGYTADDWATPNPEVNLTTLDAHGQGRVVVIRQAGPTVAGFIITGGKGYYSGGGVYVHWGSPTIRDNQIVGNSASGDGGAVWVNGGSAQIRFNRIISNSATWAGGLRIINDANVTIADNQISENVAQISGGGIEIECCGGNTPLVARNLILSNTGGGIPPPPPACTSRTRRPGWSTTSLPATRPAMGQRLRGMAKSLIPLLRLCSTTRWSAGRRAGRPSGALRMSRPQ